MSAATITSVLTVGGAPVSMLLVGAPMPGERQQLPVAESLLLREIARRAGSLRLTNNRSSRSNTLRDATRPYGQARHGSCPPPSH